MAKQASNSKRVAISKASAQLVAAAGMAGFISVFCLVASQALWTQNSYLSKVAKVKEAANQQLKTNLTASDKLIQSYKSFVADPTNAIGGSSTGQNQLKDGDNSKIILDALPDSYDFPALTSSVEKILTDRNLTVGAITGVDDEIAQASNTASPTPKPVSIVFSFVVTHANYTSIQDVTAALGHSIRPINIDSYSLAGGSTDMQLTVTAHTYYQPPKSLSIKSEIVK